MDLGSVGAGEGGGDDWGLGGAGEGSGWRRTLEAKCTVRSEGQTEEHLLVPEAGEGEGGEGGQE